MLKILSIEKYKGSTKKIEFENGNVEFINSQIIAEFNLKDGQNLPESAWEEIKAENDFRKAKERALYLLDYKDYSYVELFKKLNRNYSDDICYRVMDKMVEIGMINDRRYASALARHYVEVKKFGRFKAFQQMKLKGLTNEVINEALDRYDDSTYERLKELTEKKIDKYLDSENGIAKLKNYLVRQGYSYGLVKEAVNEVLCEIEDEN